MRRLIHERILPHFPNSILSEAGDAAALPAVRGPLAFTTDSFVVSPLFFPGGDIGTLAVNGTINDLVVAGARPRWIGLSLILEEGLPLAVFDRVIASVAAAARHSDVQIVTGDTKVVPRGAADGMFITTSGIGELLSPIPPGPRFLRPGDELIVSGPIGRHGVAILSCRENLGFEPAPVSDCAPLFDVVESMRVAGVPVRAMRDATRGGVAAVLHEWAGQCDLTMMVDETLLPVTPDVRGACELLGLDPLHVANEGTMLIAVNMGTGERTLRALRQIGNSRHAAIIGATRPRGAAPVAIRRALGTEQALDEPQGALLPRIC
jgi:hydrogenase expression/formation protein HypE